MGKKKYDVLMPKTLEQLESFLQQLLKKKPKNTIVKILAPYIGNDELLLLLNKYQKQLINFKRSKSIVFLTDDFDYDQIPDYVSIAPTEEEAQDIIDFEEIERDLLMDD